ncbi:phosphatase PAP2 family protein [Patescibacteria group bacterium]|nr:phosphatase PAP2 family protein [Patescibacteria group bacterium]
MLENFPLNLSLFNAVHGLAGVTPLLDAAGIFCALYLPYVLVLALVFFVFKQGTTKERMGVFLTLVLAAIISRGIFVEFVHFAWPVARPFAALGFTPLIGESGASFPSGHASLFFALSFMLLAFDRKWAYWFIGLSLLNGLARIFVGVHYPLDILGGIAVGFVSYLIVKKLVRPDRFRAASVPATPTALIGEETDQNENA